MTIAEVAARQYQQMAVELRMEARKAGDPRKARELYIKADYCMRASRAEKNDPPIVRDRT